MRPPGLKAPDAVVGEVLSRLHADWHRLMCGVRSWNPVFHLGSSWIDSAEKVRSVWPAVHGETLAWQDWADTAGEGVRLVRRDVSYDRDTPQSIAASLRVDSPDVAARVLGGEWPRRLVRGRCRRDLLAERFTDLVDPASILRTTDTWSDVDFDLLCRTSAWFAAPHESGRTARQIPVEGLGTKWLDKRKTVVRRLAGVDDLDLRSRPQRVHLTYLDPAYLDSRARRHDLVTMEDKGSIAYRPRVVVISENRDTAQFFPDIDGGIAIEGDGNGPGAVPLVDWVRSAELVFYWGDMDAKGLEILNDFRRALSREVRSVFMDITSYERWEQFGVDHDHTGKALGPREPRETSLLEPGERELYLALCSPEWTRHRRIEQERIPLDQAAAEVRLSDLSATPDRR